MVEFITSEVEECEANQVRVAELLNPLARAIWEALLAQTEHEASSATGARVANFALERLGLNERVLLPVSAEAMNARMALILQQKGRVPASPKEGTHWFKNTGAHSVALAGGKLTRTKHSATEYLPHLVVCFKVGSQWYLMDSTIAQVSRPEKKLTLAAFVAPVSERFVRGMEQGMFTRDDDGEGRKLLRYLPHVKDITLLAAHGQGITKDSEIVTDSLRRYTELRKTESES